jgi:hypothetical protein
VPAPGAVAVMPGPGYRVRKKDTGYADHRVGVRLRARVRVRDEHLGFMGYLGRCWVLTEAGAAPESGIWVGYRVRKAATGYAGHMAGWHAAGAGDPLWALGAAVWGLGTGYAKKV